MFIECPECATKFVVLAEQIGNGRKVRCGICKHEWFYEISRLDSPATHIPFMEHSDDELEPIPYGSNVPAIIYRPNTLYRIIRLTLVASAFMLLLLLLLLSVNRVTSIFPLTEKFYNILGISSTEHISLQDVSVDSAHDTGIITISGVIVNNGNISRRLPQLNISLYGKDKRLVLTVPLDKSSLPFTIPAHQEVAFEQRLKAPPEIIERVLLNIGNSLELALR